MNPKLIVIGGEVKTKEINLILPTVIGRGRNVTLTLPHPLVSRRHCEIYQHNGQLMVRDLGSLNGTFVNNQRIEGEHPLEPEQLLTIGSVTFRAVYSSMSDQAAAATHYDPIADRETVGRPQADTDEMDLPIPHSPVTKDEAEEIPEEVIEPVVIETKPRSNPRPAAPLDVSETLAADMHMLEDPAADAVPIVAEATHYPPSSDRDHEAEIQRAEIQRAEIQRAEIQRAGKRDPLDP